MRVKLLNRSNETNVTTENFVISLTSIELMLVQSSAIKSSLIKSLANPGLNILLKLETYCNYE